jgi:hypothetical protein
MSGAALTARHDTATSLTQIKTKKPDCFKMPLVCQLEREFAVTAYAPMLLTPEEFTSLIEVAVTSPDPNIPASHLAKLVTLGYVAVTANGLVVTGDGLIRITESE